MTNCHFLLTLVTLLKELKMIFVVFFLHKRSHHKTSKTGRMRLILDFTGKYILFYESEKEKIHALMGKGVFLQKNRVAGMLLAKIKM